MPRIVPESPTPAAAGRAQRLRRGLVRTLAGLGLPRDEGAAAPPPLSLEELRLCQVSLGFLGGRSDAESRRDRELLGAAFARHEALSELCQGLGQLGQKSATAVLLCERTLTEHNDAVLGYVDEHQGTEEQLEVRFARADLFYEMVQRRSRGRRQRAKSQAARKAARVGSEQERAGRLLREAKLREAKLPGPGRTGNVH